MKLSRNKMLLVSFMLFSLFFGAGNLIFPPFLFGQNAGSHTLPGHAGLSGHGGGAAGAGGGGRGPALTGWTGWGSRWASASPSSLPC